MTLCAVAVTAAILILVGSSLGDYDHVIYIDSVTGNNTDVCLISNNKSSPCQNLNWVLQQPQARQNSTHFVLSQGTHSLREPSSPFENLISLAFTGSDSVVACTKVGTGLVFIKVKNVFFQNVMFFKCASLQNRSIKYFVDNAVKDFQVGLYFYICENITMKHVHVSHSPNATGVGIFNTTGINSFENCNFSHNIVKTTQLKVNDDLIVGGGGILIHMGCQPDEASCDDKKGAGFAGTVYRISSCTFDSNEAGAIGGPNKLYPYILDHSGFGFGGGLSVFIGDNISGLTLMVEGSLFVKNVALSGGALFTQYNDNGHENLVSIQNTEFRGNTCPHSLYNETSGGAIQLQKVISKSDIPFFADRKRNQFVLYNCTFVNNRALKGGGIGITWPLENASKYRVPIFLISNSFFNTNVAKLGAALYLEHFWRTSRRDGTMAEVNVTNCCFKHNTDRYQKFSNGWTWPLEIGIGTVYIYSSVINFAGENAFDGNHGTALALSDGNTVFDSCYIKFSNNQGHSGGAMALLGASSFSIGEGTIMVFDNNTATTTGGAIYSSFLYRLNFHSHTSCFVKYLIPGIPEDDWNVTITFFNNTDHGGNSQNAIYTTSVLPCTVASNSSEENIIKTFCWKGWNYYNASTSSKSDCQIYIDTDVGMVQFNGSEVNRSDHVRAFPGWEFRMPILATNDYGKDISNTTIFNLRHNYSYSGKYNWGDMTSISVPENITIGITTETAGERIWYFQFFVDLQPCPPGFVISQGEDSTKVCQCADDYGGAIHCIDKAKEAVLVSGIWMGNYGGKYYTSICPAGFCSTQEQQFLTLPNNSKELSDLICASHRKGIICGECKDGYGPAVDYPLSNCVPCNDTVLAIDIVKYIASLYVPLVVLFSILIFFDIRLTTGPANAFIFHCQVVSTIFGINHDGAIPGHFTRNRTKPLILAYKIPYGIFNLRFIECYTHSICFSSRMNTLDAVLLDYGVAFFPLVVIAFIVVLLRIKENCCDGHCIKVKCTHRVTIIYNALLPAFATFLLLSYSRVNNISTTLMSTFPLSDEKGTSLHPPRLSFAGQFSQRDVQYYYYFVPGVIIFSTFVVVIPLLLLDFPLRGIEWLVAKSSCLSKFYPAVKIQILTDTFQGCYHKNMRCFAGLYFLLRLTMNIAHVYSKTLLEQFVIQQIVTTGFIILIAIFQPYKRKCINYLEILVFTNLAIINIFSLYLYVFFKTSLSFENYYMGLTIVFIIQYFLVFLPLIVMGLYLLWWWKYSRFIILKFLLAIVNRFASPSSPYYQAFYIFAMKNIEKSQRHFKKHASYQEINSQE